MYNGGYSIKSNEPLKNQKEKWDGLSKGGWWKIESQLKPNPKPLYVQTDKRTFSVLLIESALKSEEERERSEKERDRDRERGNKKETDR